MGQIERSSGTGLKWRKGRARDAGKMTVGDMGLCRGNRRVKLNRTKGKGGDMGGNRKIGGCTWCNRIINRGKSKNMHERFRTHGVVVAGE